MSRDTLIKDPRVVISVLIETKNNYMMYMVWYLDQVARLLVLILH